MLNDLVYRDNIILKTNDIICVHDSTITLSYTSLLFIFVLFLVYYIILILLYLLWILCVRFFNLYLFSVLSVCEQFFYQASFSNWKMTRHDSDKKMTLFFAFHIYLKWRMKTFVLIFSSNFRNYWKNWSKTLKNWQIYGVL